MQRGKHWAVAGISLFGVTLVLQCSHMRPKVSSHPVKTLTCCWCKSFVSEFVVVVQWPATKGELSSGVALGEHGELSSPFDWRFERGEPIREEIRLYIFFITLFLILIDSFKFWMKKCMSCEVAYLSWENMHTGLASWKARNFTYILKKIKLPFRLGKNAIKTDLKFCFLSFTP